MALTTTFAALPIEIHDAIGTHLELFDLRNLRLVCWDVTAKLVGGQCFQSYYHSKTVRLLEGELHDLELRTRSRGLGSLLRDLTIVGPLDASGTDSAELGLQHALAATFTNIRANCKDGCLRSLTLKVDTHAKPSWITIMTPRTRDPDNRPDPWEKVWESASTTFRTTMNALAESQLPIDDLDVFFSVVRCSLSCTSIAALLETADLTPCFRGLKRLSLSLSRSTRDLSQSSSDEEPESERNTDSLCSLTSILRFMQLAPELESLELHWFNTEDWALPQSERKFFTFLAPRLYFPHLNNLALRGITTTEPVLSDFILRHRITHLGFADLHLGPCDLAAFFDKFRLRLELLYVDEIWTSRLQHYRNEPGRSVLSSVDYRVPGPSSFTREGERAKQPVETCDVPIWTPGEIEIHKWMAQRRLLYGPPQ